jgi:hypothetical protein
VKIENYLKINHVMFNLIAPFLEMPTIMAVGDRYTITQELIRRVHMTADEIDKVRNSRHPGDLPISVRVQAWSTRRDFLYAVSSSLLLDPRTKARVCTYVEIGGMSLRPTYDWYVQNVLCGTIVARGMELTRVLLFPPIVYIDRRHAAVFEKRTGSFRIYDVLTNRVIGGYERCSRLVLAFHDTADMVEALVCKLIQS